MASNIDNNVLDLSHQIVFFVVISVFCLLVQPIIIFLASVKW